MAKAKFINKTNKINKVVGDVRQTQLISTYGVGAIVDFVNATVIIAGVDDWDTNLDENQKIYNENLQSLTGVSYFLSPKVSNNVGFVKNNDIPSFMFPEMLYCPTCKRLITAKEAFNANPNRPNKCILYNKDNKQCPGTLIASRFVIVCENGHMEDFPYDWWIHGDEPCTNNKTPRFSMFNVDNRSDIESLYIKCETCGKSRNMNSAFMQNNFSGYSCKGIHPHLKTKKIANNYLCNKTPKTKLRSSTSVYFPVNISALSIPPWSNNAVKVVERIYDDLILMGENYKKALLKRTTSILTIEKLLQAYEVIKARKESTLPRKKSDIYFDEYKILSIGNYSNGDDDYSAFVTPIPKGFEKYFDQITVVDKLTIVEALKGFTRLKPWDGEDDNLSPLSTYPKDWLPAVSLKGEGIFIKFNEDAISNWKTRVGKRYDAMKKNLNKSYFKKFNDYSIEEYVLLHTFSHLFIRQLSNKCGYSASSIKEKIYTTQDKKMNGVLIYLASSDCDGSLGGLINVAQNSNIFKNILENMLHNASWCSSDPLCISSTEQGHDSLNYSACHNCVLLPETSCESSNVLLDRASIVGTLDNPEIGFIDI